MMSNKELTLQFLDDLGIKYNIVNHKTCYTMEDLHKEGVTNYGNIYKNFFLRNAKGDKHYVITLPENKNVGIQKIAKQIGSTRLSFGSEERLEKHLRISKGQVGPLACINDTNKEVIFIIDKDVFKEEYLGVHPNDNSATVFLSYLELKKVFEKTGHEVVYIDIEEEL